MKVRSIVARGLFLAALASPMIAMAVPASESSIKELMNVTEAHQLVDGMRGQLDGMMKNNIAQQLNGKTPTPKQQQAIDNMTKKLGDLMQGMLAWDKLEPMYVRTYQEAFSEDEVAGMLAFYKTPAGQAVIHKMPALMQKVMGETQQMMVQSMPQMQKIMQDFAADMKAAGN